MAETEEKEKRNRNYRRRRDSSEAEKSSEEEDPTVAQVEEARAIREMKRRKHGIDITAINHDSGDGESEHISSDDPLRLRSGGGLANMNALRQMTSDAAAATTSSIGTAFAAETKRRDEDLELLRYVEEEMNRRRGAGGDQNKSKNSAANRPSNPKALLYELPDYLKVESKHKKKEENMSSQMLTGIPEVDLGIEAKMKNIEETEAAKQKLWEEMRGKKDEASAFVPTNYAVNFVQHNRWSNSTSKVAPSVQAAFAASSARRATESAAKAAEAAAAAAKVVVQISEPGSEGVGYIPPRPIEDTKKDNHRHQHRRHHSKKKRGGHKD